MHDQNSVKGADCLHGISLPRTELQELLALVVSFFSLFHDTEIFSRGVVDWVISRVIFREGNRDRTGMASLEGWGSTIELHPQMKIRCVDQHIHA